MCQQEIDIVQFLINNKDNIVTLFPNKENYPELSYYYRIAYEDKVVEIIKNFLVGHYPSELETIQLTINKNLVNIIFKDYV